MVGPDIGLGFGFIEASQRDQAGQLMCQRSPQRFIVAAAAALVACHCLTTLQDQKGCIKGTDCITILAAVKSSHKFAAVFVYRSMFWQKGRGMRCIARLTLPPSLFQMTGCLIRA